MKHTVCVTTKNIPDIILELDDSHSPKTVAAVIASLPFTVELNIWGDEIYTSESPIVQIEENSKEIVHLYDVAYWPTGKAICLFYGATPIGSAENITPASPVNVIGKIISPDKTILKLANGKKSTFELKS